MRPKHTNSAHRQSGSPHAPVRRTWGRRPMVVLALLFGMVAAAAGPAAAAGLSDAAAARPAAVAAPHAPSGARTTPVDAERVEAAAAAPAKWRHSTHSSHHQVTHQASFTSHDKPKKKKMGFFKKLGVFLIVIVVVIIVIVILLIWLIVHFIRKAFRRRG
ncbi:hypothetical protein SAZ_23385 [Streptomyces noursei ZPM]|uniref:Uncharacterized protein n=1 Tax=Streptomyces noursei TaxID=1971 RepID=A0A401R4E8_STRNR|nr:hypothetical protein [Streptomyces noursei]AKA05070.1 hypothetical protein SAZ_23385 [Streptomyces noursei ZPM]EOT01632.1 hypothetical protein K530_22782 [Streptomyces noursei CCRC 11814]EXU88044.1 hypothetical protein P354_31805 [Streptomyces noursei PD-1]UWS73445.1 hypothetical protein N1H47_20675 [Streptomyces noursei]GCB92486.1 hypothetical protein SALB_05252 [Streptomyces noursei]